MNKLLIYSFICVIATSTFTFADDIPWSFEKRLSVVENKVDKLEKRISDLEGNKKVNNDEGILLSYEEGIKKSQQTGKPLLIWVMDGYPLWIDGFITCGVPAGELWGKAGDVWVSVYDIKNDNNYGKKYEDDFSIKSLEKFVKEQIFPSIPRPVVPIVPQQRIIINPFTSPCLSGG